LCNTIKDPDLNIDLPGPEKLDFRNKEFNYDIHFKDKTFRLPQCKHERSFKDSTILKERATDIKGKSWKVERYEYKSCSECGHPLVAMDPLRGERVCECGMTNERVMMIADSELK
jgi:hypothetical protein